MDWPWTGQLKTELKKEEVTNKYKFSNYTNKKRDGCVKLGQN